MLGVFPASGGLGGSVVNHLAAAKADLSDCVFIARKPESLRARPGVQEKHAVIRTADYDKHETLEGVFDGVSVLLLISYASIQNTHRFEAHKRAIESARRSGVRHVLYTSLAFAGPADSTSSVAQVMQAHLRTEAYLRDVHAQDPSFTYTVIREGIYSESTPLYTAFWSYAKPTDTIRIPHDGKGPGVAWVKQDELGEATAKLLVQAHDQPETFEYKNKILILTGSRDWSLEETAKVLGKSVGMPVKVEQVSIDEYASQPQVQSGLTYGAGQWATKWATAFQAIRDGATATVTDDMRKILGREPEDFETTAMNLAKAARS
ncbi:hypothetical protein JCM21900_003452 [Sporobolomyces salmonicolor]